MLLALLPFETSRAIGATAYQLSYRVDVADAGCPDEEAFQRQVADRLGYQPFTVTAERALVTTVERSGPGLMARISLLDREGKVVGERSLRTSELDCAGLMETVVLDICIVVDPARVLSPSVLGPREPGEIDPALHSPAAPPQGELVPGPTPPAPADEGPSPPEIQRIDSTQEEEGPGTRPELLAGAGLIAAAGATAEPCLGSALWLGIRWPLVSVSLEGRADLPSAAPASGGEVRTSLLTGSLVPCIHYRSLGACVLLSAGVQRGEGVDLARARRSDTPHLAGGLRAVGEWKVLGPMTFRVWLELLYPFSRTTLLVDDDPVWQTPPMSGVAGAGAGAVF